MNRRTRKDAIIEGLTAEQRGMVDKWLFDKGMSYGEVAAACGTIFGVKVGRSSVGRYHERQMGKALREKRKAEDFGELSLVARSPIEGRPPVMDVADFDAEEGYERLVERIMKMALDLAEWVWLERDPAYVKELSVWARLLIAARRERSTRMLAELERKRFEIWAARECLAHFIMAEQGNPETAMGRRELRNRLRALKWHGCGPGARLWTRNKWRWPLEDRRRERVARTEEEVGEMFG